MTTQTTTTPAERYRVLVDNQTLLTDGLSALEARVWELEQRCAELERLVRRHQMHHETRQALRIEMGQVAPVQPFGLPVFADEVERYALWRATQLRTHGPDRSTWDRFPTVADVLQRQRRQGEREWAKRATETTPKQTETVSVGGRRYMGEG